MHTDMMWRQLMYKHVKMNAYNIKFHNFHNSAYRFPNLGMQIHTQSILSFFLSLTNGHTHTVNFNSKLTPVSGCAVQANSVVAHFVSISVSANGSRQTGTNRVRQRGTDVHIRSVELLHCHKTTGTDQHGEAEAHCSGPGTHGNNSLTMKT